MDTEKLFVTGFNNGYLLSKYEPVLLSQIIKNLEPTAGYLEGFFSGKEEHELEISRSHMDDINRLRNISRGRDLGLERE